MSSSQSDVARRLAMHSTIQEAEAAELFDRAIRRLASRLDETDTDRGMEGVETELGAAIVDAVIEVAERHGWAGSVIFR